MPCHSIKLDEKTFAIACIGRRRFRPCHYCKAPHEFLCDFPVKKLKNGKLKTCDRPLCRAHTQKGVSADVDFCREHYPLAKAAYERHRKNEVTMEQDNNIVAIYADGGVIKKNPSSIGGTWAWCGVNAEGERIIEKSGVVEATEKRSVSNNHTEQIAITKALEAMPDGWSGTVYSDSQIALGRVFKGWRENNLPKNISVRSKKAVMRLGHIETVLLQGHPTKDDLKNGVGKKRGLPVSIHNVWCDKACGIEAANHLKAIENK